MLNRFLRPAPATLPRAALICILAFAVQRADARQQVLRFQDLPDAIRQSNPTLEAAELGAQRSALESTRARVLPDPTVSIGYQPFPVYTARGSQRLQVRLEQAIPFPGKRKLRAELAEASGAIDQIGVRDLERSLLAEAQNAWVDIRHVERISTHIAEYRERLADFEAVAAEQYRVGTGSQQAILRMQLERTGLARTELDLNTRRARAEATLSEIVGDGFRYSTSGGPETRLPFNAQSVDSLVAIAIAHRPDVEVLGEMLRRAHLAETIARQDFYPDFGVHVNWFDIANEDIPASADGRDALSIGVAVKVPLWRSGRRAAVEQQALAQHQIESKREALARDVEAAISSLLAAVRHDTEQLALYRDALLPQAAATSEAAQSAYSTGRGDFLMLLDAERARYQLRTGFEDIRTRRARALTELAFVLGQS